MTDPLAVAFIGTFESLRMAPTFARGRRDERAGHVRSLTISGSLVVAQVRGPDDPKAFRSRIAVRAFGAAEWARVEQDLAAEARYAADLLAGRMPPDIGTVFTSAGLSLAPLSLDEVAMDCSCERWPMPCVHLAATIYALARALEEDPFGVFTWRGRSRDELLLHLRELRGAFAVEASLGVPQWAGAERAGAAGAGEPVSGSRHAGTPVGDLGDPADFWGVDAAFPPRAPGLHAGSAPVAAGGSGSAASHPDGEAGGALGASPVSPGQSLMLTVAGRPGAVTRPDALLDQLDPPPLSHGGRPITDVLRPAYLALPEE